jgi:hypothetical protein
MEYLGQSHVPPGWGNIWRVYELFKELPAIALHTEEIVDRVRVEVSG